MTRFARSKGSKASNERLPEQATSWQTMKEQLEEKNREISEKKKRKEFEDKRKENYKSFLDQRENDIKPEWAQFEETSRKKELSTTTNKKNRKKTKINEENGSTDGGIKLQEIIGEIEKVLEKGEAGNPGENKGKHKKKKKLNLLTNLENKLNDSNSKVNTVITKGKDKIDNNHTISDKADLHDDAPEESNVKISQNPSQTKIKMKNKSPKKIPAINESTVKAEVQEVSLKNDKIVKNTDKTKINPPTPRKLIEEMTEAEIKRMNKKKAKKMKKLEKKKQRKALEREQAAKEEEQNQNQTNVKKRKLPKVRDDKEHKRRKPDTQLNTMNINGVDIEIDYYDGFPIKREDAERLRKLRKEMISKSIPKSEVQTALKLERRKAEKALAREKKKVCFNCRMSGHNLSECPNLNPNTQQEIAGTGICFKCGSTEHTHFECKVVRTDNFKYATCFICREQGHISRQCPDNQKGLYPKGGACRVCGDVTHLKKDCPKFQTEQESQIIKLDTMDDDNIEGIPEERGSRGWKSNNKYNKVVKF